MAEAAPAGVAHQHKCAPLWTRRVSVEEDLGAHPPGNARSSGLILLEIANHFHLDGPDNVARAQAHDGWSVEDWPSGQRTMGR